MFRGQAKQSTVQKPQEHLDRILNDFGKLQVNDRGQDFLKGHIRMKRRRKMSKEISRREEKCCSIITSDNTCIPTPGHETVLTGKVEYYGYFSQWSAIKCGT